MKVSPSFTSIIVLLLLFVILPGCVQEIKMISPPHKTPIMRYNFPKNELRTYSISSALSEDLKVQGKKVENDISKTIYVSYRSLGTEEDINQLEGKLQFIDIRYKNTYIGEQLADTKELQKKTFQITMDPFGNEGDLLGREVLSYSINRIGEQTLEFDFEDFFPELPGYPLEIGQSWTQNDTVFLSEYGENSMLVEHKENRLSGYALVHHRECAVIKTFFTTTLKISNWSESVEWITDVEYKGDDTWFFDFKEGILVKLIERAKGGGKSIAQDIIGQVIPIKRTFSMEITLED